MRLDKFLAHAQIGTRSEVKKMIRKKQVTVNGEVVKKSDIEVDVTNDMICVNKEEVLFEEHLYIMLYKPAGYISATYDRNDPTVMDLFDPPLPNDYFPVGRLDKDTTGLLLICNDGKLAHRLLSPKYHVDKVYEVHTLNSITEKQLYILSQDMVLGEDHVKGADVSLIDSHCMLLKIQEGKFHQVKRMVAYSGNEVSSLKRLSMGPLELDDSLAAGECRLLNDEELQALMNCGQKKCDEL